jgi:hypothetical protein
MHIDRGGLDYDAVDIGLTSYRVWEQGVSRSPAMPYRTTNLFLIDLSTCNRTSKGTKRLVPYTPYIVRQGYQIRFARLIIDVYFQVKEIEHLIGE